MNINTIHTAMMKRAAGDNYNGDKWAQQEAAKYADANAQSMAKAQRMKSLQAINAPSLQDPRGAANISVPIGAENLAVQQLAAQKAIRPRVNIGRAIDKGLENFGNWLDNSWKTVQMNAGKTPNQVNRPTSAEYQKGWEIYGPGPNRERGAMSSVPGSPLWEKTPEDYERDARDAKFQRKADARYKKRQAIWDAQARQREFKRQQNYFNEFMDNAKYAPSAEDRDMYLRRMRLLPPRNETDSLISNIWFPSQTGK